MNRFVLILSILISSQGFTQTKITWKTLTDVTFTDKYSKEVEAYYYYPTFGPKVKALEGKEVIIKGYILAIDPGANYYILSSNPFASCFFCGSGGPESIIELKLKSKKARFSMDQIVIMKGILKLNADDIYQCNYILEDAEVFFN